MASKFLSSSALNTGKYNTWKKEMQVWELATTLENHRRAREAVLELDTATLNADEGMEKLYQKLDTLLLWRTSHLKRTRDRMTPPLRIFS